MKVYFAPQSRAVRTVWLLEEIGLPYELEKFQLGQKEMRGPDYMAINPNGRVPTLVDSDVTITESTAIAQYLAAKYAPNLAPNSDAPDFADYLQWLHYAEGMIMPPINNYVVETILLPPERRNDEIAMRALKLLNRTLSAVEKHMKDIPKTSLMPSTEQAEVANKPARWAFFGFSIAFAWFTCFSSLFCVPIAFSVVLLFFVFIVFRSVLYNCRWVSFDFL